MMAAVHFGHVRRLLLLVALHVLDDLPALVLLLVHLVVVIVGDVNLVVRGLELDWLFLQFPLRRTVYLQTRRFVSRSGVNQTGVLPFDSEGVMVGVSCLRRRSFWSS